MQKYRCRKGFAEKASVSSASFHDQNLKETKNGKNISQYNNGYIGPIYNL